MIGPQHPPNRMPRGRSRWASTMWSSASGTRSRSITSARGSPGRVLLPARPLGLRQDHHAAADRRIRGADFRPHHASGRTSTACRPTAATSTRCSSPMPCSPTCRCGTTSRFGLRRKKRPKAKIGSRWAIPRTGGARRHGAAPARLSCPAASSSASRWLGRSSTNPRCCSSTSRSVRSTSSCASRCSSSSCASSARSASRSSTSRTTRKKRS